ncbi:MAG: hypothetical protein WB499_19195, partial [Pseudolabrys sp.]
MKKASKLLSNKPLQTFTNRTGNRKRRIDLYQMAPLPSRSAINNVRFGSLADIAACPRYVRFT